MSRKGAHSKRPTRKASLTAPITILYNFCQAQMPFFLSHLLLSAGTHCHQRCAKAPLCCQAKGEIPSPALLP